jgi:hypothetical protein
MIAFALDGVDEPERNEVRAELRVFNRGEPERTALTIGSL